MTKQYRWALDLQQFAGEDVTGELKNLQSEMTKSWGALKTVLDQQAEEIRSNGETSTKTAADIKGIEGRLGQLQQDIQGSIEKVTQFETKMNRPDYGYGGEPVKSLGQQLVESDSYKSMVQSGANSCQGIQVKSLFGNERKDLSSGTAAGGAGLLVQPLYRPEILTEPNRQFRIRDLLNVSSINTNAVEYVRELLFSNNAAFVPEFTQADTDPADVKPESNLTFEIATSPVKTIAHGMASTRQIISDANQLRNHVDNRLLYGLKLVEETALLYGSGTGDSILGIMNTSGVQNVGNRGPTATATTMIDHIRNALTLAEVAGYPVTGIVMHPRDFAKVEQAKGSDGHYIWVSVQDQNSRRLWGIPIVSSVGIVEGEFLLGAFSMGAGLFDNESANIRVSEHHANMFMKNQIMILCEERLALAVYRPKAFVKGSFTTT
jgi:HK97 family phage major capsid protein